MERVEVPKEIAASVFGARNANIKKIARLLGMKLSARGHDIFVEAAEGDPSASEQARSRFQSFLDQLSLVSRDRGTLGKADVETAARLLGRDPTTSLTDYMVTEAIQTPSRRLVYPKSPNQLRYLQAIRRRDLVLGIGPAGTGKTFLAAAAAVSALASRSVRRLILARPAVEAGERLGFLPGDLADKVDPYLRPIYDALYEFMNPDAVHRAIERNTIEVAPIAFMRGRSLNDAFIILDEAQNTTREQMKMFLTRIGFGSRAVVTGDVTQIDLTAGKISGLIEAERIVKGIEGIEFVHFDETDVVRHPLVQRIVRAYERYDRDVKPAAGKQSKIREP